MHTLAGVWAKLDRGDEHVRAYEREEGGLMGVKEPPRVRLGSYFDQQDGTCVIFIAEVPELSTTLALLVGDAVHNYRSALDQLIFELAFVDTRGGTKRLGNKQSLDRTMFPDSDSLTNFEGNHVQTTLLAGLTKEHRAKLKRFQPYRGWDGPPPHPIRLLVDLSNDDKHRLTQPVLMCPQNVRVEVSDEELTDCALTEDREALWNQRILGRPLKPDTEICRFPMRITGPKPQVKVKGGITSIVGFRNGLSVIGGLEAIGAHSRKVVELFAPEFDRPVAQRLSVLDRPGRISEPLDTPPVEVFGGTLSL